MATSTTTRMKNRAQETYDETADAVSRGVNGARKLGRKAANRAEEAWEEGSSTIEDMASQAGRKLSYLYHEGTNKAQHSAELARDAVHSRPLAALGAAFVAGLFASVLLRR